jgi:sugar phosphate isomerase/epimerase
MALGVRLSNGVTESGEREILQDWYRWLKETGYDLVDVRELSDEVKEDVTAAGLAIGSFDVGKVPQCFSRDESKRIRSVQAICQQIESAAASGGKVCFMCLNPEDSAMPRKDSLALYKEVFPTIAKTAEQHQVKIVFEGFPGKAPYYPSLGCTPETLRAMFAAVPSPSLCVNYDPSHLVRLGIDYLRFLREFADRTAHVHAKDCRVDAENVYLYGRSQAAAFGQPIKHSEGPWRYTIPGEGSVDWATVAFELDKAGYQGAVCVELEDHRYKATVANRRRGLVKTLSYLQQYFR